MKKGVILIENRKELIKPTLDKHLPFLPQSWGLKIYDDVQIKSLNDYNKLLTSESFWESVPFEKVLIIQHDSELLREGINDFVQYDYVGAPWKFQEYGGNGGLSLRSKESMLAVIKYFPYRNATLDGYEDVYFCNKMTDDVFNMAPREICFDFSCETIFKMGTLGAHAIDKYLTKEQCNQIRNQYK